MTDDMKQAEKLGAERKIHSEIRLQDGATEYVQAAILLVEKELALTAAKKRITELEELVKKGNYAIQENCQLRKDLMSAKELIEHTIKQNNELREELVGVKKERDDLHNEAEDAILKLSSILTQLGHAGRSDDMFKDSMLLIRKLQSENKHFEKENKIGDIQSRLWTLELEVGRLGGNINAKYYHEDYVNELQDKLKSLTESIRERAAKICEDKYVAYAPEHEFARVAQLCATAIRQMELIST